ncbi:MAG: cytochrome c [Myxococcales bacterium]|jgi:mono/diheme cytochrome c family protein
MTEAMLRSRGVARVLSLTALLFALPSCQREKGGDARAAAAAQTFTKICARCHGSDGKGGVPAMEGSNAPRNFCDAAFQASRTDEQLKQVIRQGKGAMPAFGNLFSDADLEGLVLKIRSYNPDPKGH